MNIYLYTSSDIINTYLTKIIEDHLKKIKKVKIIYNHYLSYHIFY